MAAAVSARWDVVREAGPPAVCVAGVVCGLTWLAWTGLGRVELGRAGASIAVLVVGALVLAGARVSRSVAASYPIGGHGHSAAHAAKHEHGHRRVAEALGGRVRVHLGDRPRTEILSGPALTPAEHAAIAYGGHVAAGPAGCEQDHAIARAHLAQLPRSERAAAEREAWRIARRYAR